MVAFVGDNLVAVLAPVFHGDNDFVAGLGFGEVHKRSRDVAVVDVRREDGVAPEVQLALLLAAELRPASVIRVEPAGLVIDVVPGDVLVLDLRRIKFAARVMARSSIGAFTPNFGILRLMILPLNGVGVGRAVGVLVAAAAVVLAGLAEEEVAGVVMSAADSPSS